MHNIFSPPELIWIFHPKGTDNIRPRIA